LQWVAGIPSRFWNTSADSIRCTAFKYERGKEIERVPAATQQKYLKARLEQPELMNANRLVIMTASPTDEHALAAACLLATAVILRAQSESRISKVRVDDIQDYEKCLSLGREFYNSEPEVLVLYNFSPNSARTRLSLAKDLLNSHEGKYRVIVAAADNPFQFARESLYMEPHEVYHFEGRPKKKLVI
jgi:hypothetical protein